MIVLSAATYTLQLILSAGTADVDVSYVDRTATAYPIGATEQTAATATTQTICSAPAASTSREIDFLSVKIKTTGGVVTVQKLNSSGSVTTQLISVTLLDEEVLTYTHGSGWCALDANGNRKEATSSAFGAITATSITDSGLTATRVVFSGVGGLLSDDSGFTFNTTGDILTVGALNVAGTTAPTTGWYNPSGTVLRTPNAVTVDGLVTAAAGVTLSGTAANIALGSNYISNGGTDAGLSLDASNNATFSAGVTASGRVGSTLLDSSGLRVGTLVANAMEVYADSTNGPAVFFGNTASSGLRVGTVTALGSGAGFTEVARFTAAGINGVLGGTTAYAASVTTLAASGQVLLASSSVTVNAGGGMLVGAPTGGDKGAGTANFAADIYKNNTAYTNPDYVLEHWATGKIVKFADKDGAKDYTGLMSLSDTQAFARENLHLPRFGQKAGHGLFSGSDAILASVEEAYLHLFDHESRLAELEAFRDKAIPALAKAGITI